MPVSFTHPLQTPMDDSDTDRIRTGVAEAGVAEDAVGQWLLAELRYGNYASAIGDWMHFDDFFPAYTPGPPPPPVSPPLVGPSNLIARMRANSPALGYTLWYDTEDTDFIYTLEAPLGAAASDTTFRGIRVTLNDDGNPLGAVQYNIGGTLSFDNRKTDGGWL